MIMLMWWAATLQLKNILRQFFETRRDPLPAVRSGSVQHVQHIVPGATATRTVSAIVPNYNYAQHLHERIASINAQTYPIHEIIVLDDASTDNSASVIADIKDRLGGKLQVVLNAENSGAIAYQWRRGVDLAKGDIVWIAEADDVADSGFLAATARAFDNSDVVLSYCQSRQIDSTGGVLHEDYSDYLDDFDPDRWRQDYCRLGTEEIIDALCVGNTIPNISAAIFKRTALADVLSERHQELSSLRIALDWGCYLYLLRRGSIAYTARVLNSHRRHQSSVRASTDGFRHLREIQQMQRLAATLVDLPPDRVIAARLWYAAWAEVAISSQVEPSL
jgi:glycosyltransferase involved in cell wall biosynthesis